MSEHDSSARRAFLDSQISALEPLDFVVAAVPAPPFDAVRVDRRPDGRYIVGVLSREPETPYSDEQQSSLAELGFTQNDDLWEHPEPCEGSEDAATLAERVIDDVFGVEVGDRLDVRHGSARDEHLAAQKVEQMRARIAPVVESLLGQPAAVDEDGDFIVDLHQSRVYVAPRALPGRPSVVRVFAITNAGVNLAPELGNFLSRLNFSLMFGRFSLDQERGAVWFDETLLGDHVSDEELRFAVEMVAATANEWDQKIAQLFGGTTRRVVSEPEGERLPSKPGQGGYL